ncbi:MAG: hypothetical protein GC162_06080 [Planctomycetes bacterium]|nr:hypothetical protein [Planctomycetota bacterium]
MSESQHTPNQHQRWLKYGLNVAVLILATIVIVVLVNWIGHRHYQRFDFTQSRQYSLSPQTTKLLEKLKTPVNITTFYVQGTAEGDLLTKVDDLLTEYNRRANDITITHIDPALNPEKRDQFIADLTGRFQSELDTSKAAIEGVKKTFDDVKAFANAQTAVLPQVMTTLAEDDRTTPLLMKQLNQIYMRLGEDLGSIAEQIDTSLKSKMPDYRAAAALARSPLEQLSSGVLKVAIERFQKLADDPKTPDAEKDAVLGMLRSYKSISDEVQAATSKLDDVRAPGYTRIRNSLLDSNCVVVTTPAEKTPAAKPAEEDDTHGVVVLTLDEIYPNLVRAQVERNEVRPEDGYKGEEVITGAILRLTYKHDTRIVFINPAMQSVMQRGDPSQTYSAVIDRLQKMNFKVDEWQPGGSMGPGGQPMPPQPKPTPQPGQTMIFVALPAPAQDPRRQQMPLGPMIASAVKEHLDAGQPAMVMLAPSSMMAFGQPDPMLEPLKDWGITADVSRSLLTAVPGNGGRMRTINQITIDSFPPDTAIGKAVRGLKGVLVRGVALNLPAAPPKGVTLEPLAKSPDDCWDDTDYFQMDEAKKDDTDPKGPFVVAAAASKGDNRLVVVGDPVFASDMVANAGPQDLFGNTVYAAFPANAELFVNSIYWLAHQDQLIAPGARTQDTRRIEPMTRGVLVGIWWFVLAGVPAVCLALGAFVWSIRRR